MYNCFKKNLGVDVSNSLEWIKCTFDLMELLMAIITTPENFWEEKRVFNKEERKYLIKKIKKIKFVKREYTGNELFEKVVDMT